MLSSTPTAKYYQLSQLLREQIEAGELHPNQQFPTEESLTTTYNVSRGTVRKAVDLLETQGLVRREQGRGTFISDPSANSMGGFTLDNFAERMAQQQRRPSTKVLDQHVVCATQFIADKLDLTVGDPVIHIARLRLADNEPILYEQRFLAKKLCPELESADIQTQSIHTILVNQLPLIKVTHSVEMKNLTADNAHLLNTAPNTPAFAIERLTYTKDTNDQPIPAVFYTALCRSDEYQFKAQFQSMI